MNALPTLEFFSDIELIDKFQFLEATIVDALGLDKASELRFFQKDDSAHALIIKGMPLDNNLAATPYDSLNYEKCPVSIMSLLAFYAAIGINPVAYIGENHGRLIRGVFAKKSSENEASSHGSNIELGYHMDHAHLSLPGEHCVSSNSPEILGLLSLRGNSSVPTYILAIDEIIEALDKKTLETLNQPLFDILPPDSVGYQNKLTKVPILVKNENGSYLSRYNAAKVIGLTKEASEAIKKLDLVISSLPKSSITLMPGECLIFKNQRTLHARPAFSSDYEGMDRWYLRLFGTTGIDKIHSAHPLLPFLAV